LEAQQQQQQQQQEEKKDVQPSFNLDPGRNLLYASPTTI